MHAIAKWWRLPSPRLLSENRRLSSSTMCQNSWMGCARGLARVVILMKMGSSIFRLDTISLCLTSPVISHSEQPWALWTRVTTIPERPPYLALSSILSMSRQLTDSGHTINYSNSSSQRQSASPTRRIWSLLVKHCWNGRRATALAKPICLFHSQGID